MAIVEFKTLHSCAKIPEYKTAGSVGADLSSIENVVIPAGEFRLVRTGIAVQLPHGVEMQIRPRSGLAIKHGITVLNSPGTIDSDYTGEIGAVLINHGTSDFHITEGDRIAQAVLNEVVLPEYIQTETLSPTERGDQGFGSTGIK